MIYNFRLGLLESPKKNRLCIRHLILVYVFANRPLILDDQWLFFPERDYLFSRIFEQKQMNTELRPSRLRVAWPREGFARRNREKEWPPLVAPKLRVTPRVIARRVPASR